MILVLKLDLDIIKMYVCTKMKFLPSAFQKLSSEQTDRQIDGQTDRQTWLNLLPTAYADGNYNLYLSDRLSWKTRLDLKQ